MGCKKNYLDSHEFYVLIKLNAIITLKIFFSQNLIYQLTFFFSAIHNTGLIIAQLHT